MLHGALLLKNYKADWKIELVDSNNAVIWEGNFKYGTDDYVFEDFGGSDKAAFLFC